VLQLLLTLQLRGSCMMVVQFHQVLLVVLLAGSMSRSCRRINGIEAGDGRRLRQPST
jgi:hypothetical protein